MSAHEAQAAPRPASWDRILPSGSFAGAEATPWGSVCKREERGARAPLYPAPGHQVRATFRRPGPSAGPGCPAPPRAPGCPAPGCTSSRAARAPGCTGSELHGLRAARAPDCTGSELGAETTWTAESIGGSRAWTRPAWAWAWAAAHPRPPRRVPSSRERFLLPPSPTDPGRRPSCQNRGCLFHSGSQSPKGEQGALMLVFGHKQLSLIILFLLSLPVPPASPRRSGPPNPRGRRGAGGSARPGARALSCPRGFRADSNSSRWGINPGAPAFRGL